METTYLVEIRLGLTKWRICQTVREISCRYPVDEFIEKHPHITLFGPFVLREGITSRILLDILGSVAGRFDPVRFRIDGWDRKEGMHGNVIAFRVIPSSSLRDLTRAVAEALSPLTESLIVWDATPDRKWFHVTIANRLQKPVADAVYSGLSGLKTDDTGSKPSDHNILLKIRQWLRTSLLQDPGRNITPPLLDESGLRVTVMQDAEILAEYDFLTKEWMTGDFSHKSGSWQRTLSRYRHAAGFELKDPIVPRTEDIFFIADLHLGHANIIRYCSRPFLSADSEEMDHVLVKNWNYSIMPENTVYFLGDLCYGKKAWEMFEYRKKLKGRILFIRGNHDTDELTVTRSAVLEQEGIHFFLVHDPVDAPGDFDGWVIHGHHHNNDLRHFPFVDFRNRRINVSAEVIGYVPVTLREICSVIKRGESTGGTDHILLRYPHVS